MAGRRTGGLGKGLDALIPNKAGGPSKEPAKKTRSAVVKKDKPTEKDNPAAERLVKISSVEPNLNQPRRHFDEDALLELSDRAKDWGLTPVAAGAFIGEHSYSRPSLPVAEGRPDEDDLKRCRDFAAAVIEKLHRCGSLEQACDFPVKGSQPYKALKTSTPQAPITLPEKCLRCGSCLKRCPTQAIFRATDGSIDTDKGRCIKCCACVKDCPAQARVFDTPFSEFLHTHFSARREPEFFL